MKTEGRRLPKRIQELQNGGLERPGRRLDSKSVLNQLLGSTSGKLIHPFCGKVRFKVPFWKPGGFGRAAKVQHLGMVL